MKVRAASTQGHYVDVNTSSTPTRLGHQQNHDPNPAADLEQNGLVKAQTSA